MKPIIKKIKKALKIAAVGCAISTTLLASVLIHQNIKLSNYSSDDQINSIAEYLNCDTGYMKKIDNHFVRMEHNGDEPIYVYFDNSVSEQNKSIAIESLDYVFGIIGEVNDKYQYKVVDKSVYDSKFNKTTIKYSIGDPEIIYQGEGVDMGGIASSEVNLLSKLTNKRTTNRFHIAIRDEEGENVAREKRLYTFIHELLHLVGFEDVHTLKSIQTTTKYCGNTIMQSSHSGKMACVLTPNDYKSILSVYTSKLSKEELLQKKAEYDKKAAEYEEEYYKYFTEKVTERNQVTEKLEQGDLDFEGHLSSTMLDGTSHHFNYEIKIRGNQYQFKILDENYKLLDKTIGEVFWNNGVAVLKGVELKHGLRPGIEEESYEGGYVEDLALTQKGNHVELYNVFSNESYWLRFVELENDLIP